MATKLHQILALEKGVKAQTESDLTRAYHDAQRADAFKGLTRVYKPNDEENGDRLPTERKIVQLTADRILSRGRDALTRQANIVGTKDAANQTARADVVVGGNIVAVQVPVATLLYLEKSLQKFRELVTKLPTLDPEVEWGTAPDAATGLWKSATDESVRTKKTPRALVKYEATPDHPAQVETYVEDAIVGRWDKTLFSGALPAFRKQRLLHRVDEVTAAVKMAREEANTADAVDVRVGDQIFGILLTD